MKSEKGIAVAGNIIADIVKTVDTYPKVGMMAQISDISYAVGGCVPNTAIDLAKIDGNLPVSVFGRTGTDEYGKYIVSELKKHKIDIGGISMSDGEKTSFCDVMSMPTGERTFFHKKGANAEFSPSDINLNNLNCVIFHIGYILLLDKFDKDDDEYGTVMARFLKSVQECGIKTSIDVVSDTMADYGKKIVPALKYCDYAIMNELECCNTWSVDAYNSDGSVNYENIEYAMRKTADAGVGDKVVVHSKKISFLLDVKADEFVKVPSLKIPTEEIKGSVGAGDAFCAGCLYAIYKGYENEEILKFASAAAACNLFEANSTDGMKSKVDIEGISEKYGRLSI